MKKLFSIIFIHLLFTIGVNAQISNRKAENMVIDNDLKGITQLIENGLDINKTFKDNRTLLNMAVRYGRFNIVKFLVEKGADMNLQDVSLHTPLLLSSSQFWRNDSISEYLIYKGADPNVRGQYGTTALRNTIGVLNPKTQNIKIFKLLVENGADINFKCNECNNSSIFLYCCGFGTPEMLEILIKKGVDINQTNNYGVNGLMWAITAKNPANAKFLIKNGIDLNHLENRKQSATAYAIANKFEIIPDGYATYYDKKGRLRSETPYKDGAKNGVFKFYYPNGQLRQSIEYVNGKECGLWRDYYKNGQLKEEIEYDGEDGIVNDTYYTWNTKGEKFMHKGIWIERGGKTGRLHYSSSKLKYIKTKVH